MPINIV